MISNDEYGQLLEEHSSTQSSLAANKIISGTILNISDQSITVDIGHKSEGQIPKDEFISSGDSFQNNWKLQSLFDLGMPLTPDAQNKYHHD